MRPARKMAATTRSGTTFRTDWRRRLPDLGRRLCFPGTGAGATIPAGIVVGAEVQLTATVAEFASTNQLSVTQLNPVAGTTSVVSTGNALPTAVRIGDVDNLTTGLERKPALVSLGDDDVDRFPRPAPTIR